MFAVVAILGWIYAIIAVFTPPSRVLSVTGWVLNADGQWLAKLLGMALASQAWVAWTLSATVDWVMWRSYVIRVSFQPPPGVSESL